MSVIDHYKFRERGAFDCGNSHYCLFKTRCCGAFYVEDTELVSAYLNPDDLTEQHPLWRNVDEPELTCPFCGSADWIGSEVLELSEVPPHWKWAGVSK